MRLSFDGTFMGGCTWTSFFFFLKMSCKALGSMKLYNLIIHIITESPNMRYATILSL